MPMIFFFKLQDIIFFVIFFLICKLLRLSYWQILNIIFYVLYFLSPKFYSSRISHHISHLVLKYCAHTDNAAIAVNIQHCNVQINSYTSSKTFREKKIHWSLVMQHFQGNTFITHENEVSCQRSVLSCNDYIQSKSISASFGAAKRKKVDVIYTLQKHHNNR